MADASGGPSDDDGHFAKLGGVKAGNGSVGDLTCESDACLRQSGRRRIASGEGARPSCLRFGQRLAGPTLGPAQIAALVPLPGHNR